MAAGFTATLDDLTAWVVTEIANDLEYLVPSDDWAAEGFEPEYANPSVFQGFVPSVERLKEGEHQSPSIAVQLLGGEDNLDDLRALTVRLMLTIWMPGRFEGGRFARSSDGWRELFNGLDAMVRAVERADTIANCAIDRTYGVRFGMYEREREIPDLFPYWMGQVEFRLRRSPHAHKRFDDLL